MYKTVGCMMLGVMVLLAGGCNTNARYMTDDRMSRGLIVILPGIEGESGFNRNIRAGLEEADLGYAIEIYHWGWSIPLLGMGLNQVDVVGNEQSARKLARHIAEYQDDYPGKPVYVIGHSGGGGIAVLAAEAMADLSGDHKIDGLVLLSASISSNYNLGTALRQCRKGIVNFYNPDDVALLQIGTAIAGNIDGGHGASAGRVGFKLPGTLLYGDRRVDTPYSRLYQVEVTPGMIDGARPHAGNTNVGFVSVYVAEWVIASVWPPAGVPLAEGVSPSAPERRPRRSFTDERPEPYIP